MTPTERVGHAPRILLLRTRFFFFDIINFSRHCVEHGSGVEALSAGLKIHLCDVKLRQTDAAWSLGWWATSHGENTSKSASGYGLAPALHSPPESRLEGHLRGSSSRMATSALIRPSSYTSGRPSPVSTAVSRSRLSPTTPASPSRRSGVSMKIGATSTSAARPETTASTRHSPTSARWRMRGRRIPPSKSYANASSDQGRPRTSTTASASTPSFSDKQAIVDLPDGRRNGLCLYHTEISTSLLWVPRFACGKDSASVSSSSP